MPTTRPGYVWSGTEWIAIGQEAVVAPIKYQATAPSSPATGDIWIESDVDVPSIDSAQFLRWRKTMTGGETSLSGNDDSSLPLAYTPGYEQLYINGVLQVRGQDYTATTGTTVTGLTALVANDVVEIFSAVARTVADVYTQTQSDARFINKTGGIIQIVNATYDTQISNTTVTPADTGLTATITPRSATSKILVQVNQNGVYANAGTGMRLNLLRNGTLISKMGQRLAGDSTDTTSVGSASTSYLDSPNSTSAVTYKTQFNSETAGQSSFVNVYGAMSTITLMEIGA
jgi:hypothetical protein